MPSPARTHTLRSSVISTLPLGSLSSLRGSTSSTSSYQDVIEDDKGGQGADENDVKASNVDEGIHRHENQRVFVEKHHNRKSWKLNKS